MRDHYETLGLQPSARQQDRREERVLPANSPLPPGPPRPGRYAAGRAATAAAFRRAKGSVRCVLYDEGRRAEYDRTIRPSSSASGGGNGNRHGQYGAGASSRSSGFTTQTWEARKEWAEWDDKWEASKKKWAEWDEKREASKKKWAEWDEKWAEWDEKREASKKKWAEWDEKWEM
nr:uncharacterized protein LOC127326822 [Lolium perenne]